MKRILLIGISFILIFILIGCEVTYAPEIDGRGADVYVKYELGVNFTDHMMAVATREPNYLMYLEGKMSVKSEDKLIDWSNVMFTHQLDYLYPQIFYFIPMHHNFDTSEKWAIYFKNWVNAIEERDLSHIENYLLDTTIEGYVQEIFNKTDDALWSVYYEESIGLLEMMEKIYISEFSTYYNKIWPDLSFELNQRCNYINDLMPSMALLRRWESYTQLAFKYNTYIISLSKVKSQDMMYASIHPQKAVMYAYLREEPFEFGEVISHHLGYQLLTQDNSKLFESYINDYEPMSEDYNLYTMLNDTVRFLVSQYNNYIMKYDTEQFKTYMADIEAFPFLRFNLPPQEPANERLKDALDFYFNYNSFYTPYHYDDGVHYQGEVFEELVVNDIKLHVKPGFPMIWETEQGYRYFTKDPESYPSFNPTNDKMLFISPFHFELVGDLYLYNFNNNTLIQMTEIEFYTQQTIKKVVWYDENIAYFIKGFTYGTVSQGGQLYQFNIKTKETTLLDVVQLNSYQEVADFEIVDKIMTVTVVTHDESYRSFTEKQIVYLLED